MTIAEKYSNLKAKSIKDMVLEIVEEVAKNCKTNSLEIVCGWWETDDLPKAEKNSQWFDLMAGECYHNEINRVLKEQGFRAYENYGGFRWRARTTYRLEQ